MMLFYNLNIQLYFPKSIASTEEKYTSNYAKLICETELKLKKNNRKVHENIYAQASYRNQLKGTFSAVTVNRAK